MKKRVLNSSRLPDTFFLQNATCFGWGTWRRAWCKFNPDANSLLQMLSTEQIKKMNYTPGMDYLRMLRLAAEGKISSWAVRWYASIIINNGLSLHPKKSFVNNTGYDGSGVHTGIFHPSWSPTLAQTLVVEPIPLEVNYHARRLVHGNYLKTWFFWKLEGLINRLGLQKVIKKLIQ